MRTNLLPDAAWKTFPQEYFTPIEKIVEVVLMLLQDDKKQSNGVGNEEPFVGQTVEINCSNHYFRTQYDWCDEQMATIMGSTA